MSKIDLTDNVFGRLLVLGDSGLRDKIGRIFWSCVCSCGIKKTIRSDSLRSGSSKSCGCFRNERVAKANKGNQNLLKHGHNRRGKITAVYMAWTSMKTRCLNNKCKRYGDYGGRGIKICKSWLKFENFLRDMGERPVNTSIDRINNDGNYEPGNCRWATRKQQANNKRR